MKITTIIIIIVIIAILVKTGSPGKSFGFFVKYLIFPTLGAALGCIIGYFLGSYRIGIIVGAVAGCICVIKDAKNKLS